MNERMLELAKQAGLKKEHGNDREYIGNFEWRMFGELIVRECSLIPDWCIETGKDQFVETCMAERTSKMIKQHFGVK